MPGFKPAVAKNPVQSVMPNRMPMQASGRAYPDMPMMQPMPSQAAKGMQMASSKASGTPGMTKGRGRKMPVRGMM